MKKFIVPVIAIVALFIIGGCSTKFNIAAPYKNITVIYGLLDESDTAHYIRVQKAFLSQNLSALTMAETPDSSFYASLDVKIKRIDYSGNMIDTIHLNRVDLDQEGYPKQPGVFFTAPNYAYKFKNQLNPNYIYRIMVTNPATNETDSADAPVIDDQNIYTGSFYVTLFDNIVLNKEPIDFSSTLPAKTIQISSQYTPLAGFNFEGAQSPVAIAQVILRFFWSDSNAVTKVVTPDTSFDYNAGYQQLSTNSIDYFINNTSLYGAIASGMGTPDDNVYRLIDRCELFIYLGTEDFSNSYQNSLTQGIGLTGNEIEPVYTNIQGANVLGLYTSRGLRSGYLTISNNTIDSLENSPYTQQVRIAGTVYH